MYGIDKVIEELKGRVGGRFDIDGTMNAIKKMKATSKEDKPTEITETAEAESLEGVEPVIEMEATEVSIEGIDEGTQDFADKINVQDKQMDKDGDRDIEKVDDSKELITDGVNIGEYKDGDKAETIVDTNDVNRLEEISKSIKTFFPNENTEDVLIRIISNLLNR